MRLDSKSKFPSGMEDYLEGYGWHFSKRMAEWATSRMYDRDGKSVSGYTRASLDNLYRTRGIKPKNIAGYDDVYVANMCLADFMGSSIKDEASLLLYVKDVLDDPDGYEGLPFTRFYADCIGSGTPIVWEDML